LNTAKETPEKKRTVYKGTTMTLGDIIEKKLELPIVVETSGDIPRFYSRYYGNVGTVRMPRFLIIEAINPSPYDNDYKFLETYSYQNGRIQPENQKNVPLNYSFRILTGTQAKKILAIFSEGEFDRMTSTDKLYYHDYLGSDPEIFVEDENGIVVPAFTFLGKKGTSTAYWDGFQAEFTVTPQTCMAYMMDSVQAGLRLVYNSARTKHGNKVKLSHRSVMIIPQEMLDSAEQEFIELGCKPSLNVYGLEGEKVNPRKLTIRPAGGHMHFTLRNKDPENIKKAVKAMDAILAVMGVAVFENFDNPIRRRYYGLAGEYRTPAHGLEYRALSNGWLMHPAIAHLFFEVGRTTLRFGENNLLKYWKASEQETIEVIQSSDAKAARQLLERNRAVFDRILASTNGQMQNPEGKVWELIQGGIEELVADPTDIAGNWLFKKQNRWVTHSNGQEACWAQSRDRMLSGKKI
jgi:Phage phiEco32-like COOH.NH2 ligase-type 2